MLIRWRHYPSWRKVVLMQLTVQSSAHLVTHYRFSRNTKLNWTSWVARTSPWNGGWSNLRSPEIQGRKTAMNSCLCINTLYGLSVWEIFHQLVCFDICFLYNRPHVKKKHLNSSLQNGNICITCSHYCCKSLHWNFCFFD